MPSPFLVILFAALLDAAFLLAAKFAPERFNGIAPNVGPRHRILLTEKQIERKRLRKEERLKTREEERKKRQEEKYSGSNNTTVPFNVTDDSPTNSPTTSMPSIRPSSSPTPSPTFISTAQLSSTPSEILTTDMPSLRPSITPSSPVPTSSPSDAPSLSPTTSKPSNRPTCSQQSSDVPTSLPSAMPSTVQTTIVCDGQDFLTNSSGLSMAIIRFKYQIEFKPSVSIDDAIVHVDLSVAQTVANAFLPCFQPDESANEAGQGFELLAVDSLPKDTVSTTEVCSPAKSNWGCVVVLGAITAYASNLAQFDLNAVLSSIETSSLNGALNLPQRKAIVTYLSPTATAGESVQQAPALPSPSSAQDVEQSLSDSRPTKHVFGIAVSVAFVGSVAFAFLLFRYRQRFPPNGALQADRDGNVQPPPSQYEASAGFSSVGGGDGGDVASCLSEDTFWRSIMGKRTRASSSNYQSNNARYESDASVALSSIGVSLKGALGLEDDMDIESCGSSIIDAPSCLAEVK